MKQKNKVLLSIAGFDPLSRTGVSADFQVAHGLGFSLRSAITAIVAQTDDGVLGFYPIMEDSFHAQLEAVNRDGEIAGIKIGVLGSERQIDLIVDFLCEIHLPVVLDPVLETSSGYVFPLHMNVSKSIKMFAPHCSLICPNFKEAGHILESLDSRNAAKKICSQFGIPVVVTGVTCEDGKIADVLCEDGEIENIFAGNAISADPPGTGCRFSTAICCNLSSGKTISDSVYLANRMVCKYRESLIGV